MIKNKQIQRLRYHHYLNYEYRNICSTKAKVLDYIHLYEFTMDIEFNQCKILIAIDAYEDECIKVHHPYYACINPTILDYVLEKYLNIPRDWNDEF